jgi:hypothetical protein
MSSEDIAPSEQPPAKIRERSRVKVAIAIIVMIVVVLLAIRFVFIANEAGNRMHSTKYLMIIGLAFQNYESAKGRLPPQAICDKDGNKLLSWRVAILPYMEEDQLYARFKLDEPWDSPNNAALIPEMPLIYATPKADKKKGLAYFKVFSGKGTPFEMEPSSVGPRSKWTLADLTASPCGLSNLIFCIETDDPVIWTKPEDWDYDPNQPLPAMKPVYKGYFMVGKGDGSLMSVRQDRKETAIRASIDPNSTSKESLDQ